MSYTGITTSANVEAAQTLLEFWYNDGYLDWLSLSPEGKFPMRQGTADNPTQFISVMTIEKQIQDHLIFIYGTDPVAVVFEQLRARLTKFRRQHPELGQAIAPQERLTEANSILITYGDQVQQPGKPALQSLAEVLDKYLQGVMSSVHILPFYPYSSDDGFAVIDYLAVDPALGNWVDVTRLGQSFRLMVDAVINHISAHSAWFQGFMTGNPKYADYFITIDPSTDLSRVTRPRTLPLLTAVETPTGTQHVWTTFSADQIDLNYKNPALLLEIIDVFLFYVAQGAKFIRLDAIALLSSRKKIRDLFSGPPALVEDQTLRLTLEPYEVRWLGE